MNKMKNLTSFNRFSRLSAVPILSANRIHHMDHSDTATLSVLDHHAERSLEQKPDDEIIQQPILAESAEPQSRSTLVALSSFSASIAWINHSTKDKQQDFSVGTFPHNSLGAAVEKRQLEKKNRFRLGNQTIIRLSQLQGRIDPVLGSSVVNKNLTKLV